MRNWKTLLAGLAAILTVVAKLINDPHDINTADIASVAAGIGLIFAKDGDVTGGTRYQ